MPAFVDARGEGRGIFTTAGFFLVVKMQFKECNALHQGRDKAMRCAVALPDTEGETAGRKEKYPFLLFLIGSKTLRIGKTYPERGKET